MAVKIKRGSDKKFVIKLRTPSGDPFDITNADNITVKLPKKDGTKTVIDYADIPAVAAKATYLGVTFTAVTPGKNGNTIQLVFDGAMTITAVITAWNTANALNQVSSNAPTPNTTVLAAGSFKLANGSDLYNKVKAMAPFVLGKLLITLPNSDTANLRLANEQSVEVLVSEGSDPSVDDTGLVIPNAIDVID